jgi:hypothetical protein
MAFISPPVEDKIEHLRLLLGLAEDPNHVQTTMDGPTGLAFYIPEYLAELYVKALEIQAAEARGETEPEEVPKRKPGRPRKNTDTGS